MLYDGKMSISLLTIAYIDENVDFNQSCYIKDVSVEEVINQQLRLIITRILFIQLPFIDRFLIKT